MKKITTLLLLCFSLSISAQVGIGTTSPTEALDVETNDATKTAIDINNSSTGDPLIHFQVSGIARFTIGVDNDDSDKFKIGTTAVETSTALTIDASQNVGIGNTAPTATLDVDGSAIFNESHAAVDFRIEGDTEANLFFVDGSTDRIGIGTSTPANTLDIEGDLILQNGTNINEFSTDGTLAGNSDDAVPTEQAVKTYVDGKQPSLSKTITIESPTNTDYFPVFRTDVAITIQEAIGMLNAAGDVDVRLYWDTDFAETSPTAIGTTTTLTATTEATVNIASDATIPANSWVFIDIPEATTAQTLTIDVRYTED